MPTPPPDNPAPAPVLFFSDRLPPPPAGESDRDTEARVRLALEASAPLPPERLAYGWVRLPSRDLLYYAAPAERLPPPSPDAEPGTVLPPPDAVLLPPGVTREDFLAASRSHHADLRPRALLDTLRAGAESDRLLARLRLPLRAAVALAVLSLLAAAALHGTCAWREHRLASRAPALAAAEASSDLLASLDRLGAASRSPFDLLAVVNTHRPDAITFSRLRAEDPFHLTLEGRAAGVAELNRFADTLRDCGLFSSLSLPKISTSAGRTSFELRLTASRWPSFTDAPAPTPPAPARP